jgi:Anti-sigma-K factor rskA, C-terminal
MNHAEAHEYIADLALEPGRLIGLASSTIPADAELRRHAAECQRCAAELAAWQSVQGGLADALGRADGDDVHRIAAPDGLRRQVLASAQGASTSSRRLRLPLRLGMRLGAAALAIVLVAAGAVVIADQASNLNASNADRQALAAALQTTSQVLADPAHRAIALSAPAGSSSAASGTFAWTRRDLVVLASGLAPPAAGQIYRCWAVGPSGTTPVGQMQYVDGEAFWVGALYDWASVDLPSAQSFAVTLESAQGGATQSGPVVLEGTLGG